MHFKRILCFVLVLALSLMALSALSGCDAASQCVLEAEKAVIEPEYDTEQAEIVRANSRSENITSNGKYVGELYAGSAISWFFTEDQATTFDIRIAVANAQPNSPAFASG